MLVLLIVCDSKARHVKVRNTLWPSEEAVAVASHIGA